MPARSLCCPTSPTDSEKPMKRDRFGGLFYIGRGFSSFSTRIRFAGFRVKAEWPSGCLRQYGSRANRCGGDFQSEVSCQGPRPQAWPQVRLGPKRLPFGPRILSGRNDRSFRWNQVQLPQLQPHLQAQPEGILPFQTPHHPHCVQDLQQLLL